MKKLLILVVIFISCSIFADENLIENKPISYIYDIYTNGDIENVIDRKCITKNSIEEHVSFLCQICGNVFLFKKTNEICGEEDE